jgi:hypothetical protein
MVKLLNKKKLQIETLCKDNGIELVINPHLKNGGFAHFGPIRKIEIKEIKSNVTYAYALHELGHLLGTRQSKANSELEQEAAAWKYAREHAIEWTNGMEKVLQDCLEGYLKYAKNNSSKRIAVPVSGSFYWRVRENRE